MKNRDLSVIITARNEEWLARTVADVLDKKRGNTEVIVIADGNWPKPALEDHPDLTIIYHKQSVGQRAAINEAARLSRAKFIMKLDAHCIVGEGFDEILMRDCEPNWTVVPRLYNLHAFNWQCKKCGNVWYQGPTPTRCYLPGERREVNKDCDSKEFERVVVWQPRLNRKNDFMGFDRDLKFQYWGELGTRAGQDGGIATTMSLLGACFFMHRDWYWAIGGSDEAFGSWGQQGTEIACKTWLSGGELKVNKNTWYSHLFRTQGGDFGYPYQISGNQVNHAREYSKELFKRGTWPLRKHKLSWLIEKFWPIKNWDQKDLDELRRIEGNEVPEKGIIYYTDNQLNMKIAHRVQDQLKRIGLPIVSASLKPMKFGVNVHIAAKRGYLTMFKQILAALEASTSDYVFFCEHDVLYHPSHFQFTPERKDVWYYNTNVWRVNSETGEAIRTANCKQVSGICVYRQTAVEHYRKRIEKLEKWLSEKGEKNFNWFIRRVGFEPGTHNREERVDMAGSQTWESEYPNIDIRHGANLTATKWKKEDFRNEIYTKGWTESHVSKLPGWSKHDLAFLGL